MQSLHPSSIVTFDPAGVYFRKTSTKPIIQSINLYSYKYTNVFMTEAKIIQSVKRWIMAPFPTVGRIFSLLSSSQTGSGAHPASETGGSFNGTKAAGA
jgi:hypothetical protein